MEIGDIVISLAGHDTGKPFIVIANASENFVLIADGMSRGMENPKLKRKKHLRVADQSGIKDPTNAALSKRIKQFIRDRRLYAEK
ncbi:MAG: RNA-binding protein [Clostridiales bacterium]|nr:RNA-binding protein [Clostridiales bacterium]